MKMLNNFQLLLVAISLAMATASTISNIITGGSFGWQLGAIIWIFNYYRVAKIYDDTFGSDY